MSRYKSAIRVLYITAALLILVTFLWVADRYQLAQILTQGRRTVEIHTYNLANPNLVSQIQEVESKIGAIRVQMDNLKHNNTYVNRISSRYLKKSQQGKIAQSEPDAPTYNPMYINQIQAAKNRYGGALSGSEQELQRLLNRYAILLLQKYGTMEVSFAYPKKAYIGYSQPLDLEVTLTYPESQINGMLRDLGETSLSLMKFKCALHPALSAAEMQQTMKSTPLQYLHNHDTTTWKWLLVADRNGVYPLSLGMQIKYQAGNIVQTQELGVLAEQVKVSTFYLKPILHKIAGQFVSILIVILLAGLLTAVVLVWKQKNRPVQ
jgi:hypothetical protein